jgi:hypothetical protein
MTLEFIVWLLYGADGLRELSRDLQTGQEGSSKEHNGTFHDGREASPTVLGWLRKLKDCKHPAKRIIDLVLDLIQDNVLQVAEKRLPARAIYRAFQDILRGAEEQQQSLPRVGLDVIGLALDNGPDPFLGPWVGSSIEGYSYGMPRAIENWFQDSAFYTADTGIADLSGQGNNPSFDLSTTSGAETWAYDWQELQGTLGESDISTMSSSVAINSACFDTFASSGAGEGVGNTCWRS